MRKRRQLQATASRAERLHDRVVEREAPFALAGDGRFTGCARQREEEGRADAAPGFGPDAAAVRFDDTPGDEQPQTRSALVRSPVLLEDVRQVARFDAA